MIHVTITCHDCGATEEYDLEGIVMIGETSEGVRYARHNMEYKDAFKLLSRKLTSDIVVISKN
jgi:hypothetical protein